MSPEPWYHLGVKDCIARTAFKIMPTYEYECESHGGFTAIRPLLEFRDPQPCPTCATPSPRVTLTVPALHGMFSSPSAASTGNSLQSCCGGNCSCG